MNIIDKYEKEQMKDNLPEIRIGDKVRVSTKIVEGSRERLQVFEGVVIARHRGNNRESITVRKQSYAVGVERVFPLHAPVVDKVEVVSRAKVRRAKLYYLREKKGKSARLKELRG
ncbi:MAG: 50S ribosomal protein L19 [Desulfomonilia bacterium]|jgi:large subunit ribosomal protein L19|uniref:50S ribosomal subunit protein L19 n=1 Tax=anaerobic digester metagenome TaxID=1263854 RepID=A0A485M7V3_9ZZZZ|nr:50S ribosomal protein L19 [Pseudomonadota bacterium]HON37706.1 50S ribosomal protein L19 [Deltaproteobacteria bacterium]HRS55199.1 50S ribosomal protein L19 [Desulfomonilia bacterium]HPD20365.1 50S ribosomal protein L19 [Deltaproteobacteria bacterium]HPX17178.1 50S ribosomal protein L19 [Deltaproteobacteria bacterium]